LGELNNIIQFFECLKLKEIQNLFLFQLFKTILFIYRFMGNLYKANGGDIIEQMKFRYNYNK
jgi:hypothetical protein